MSRREDDGDNRTASDDGDDERFDDDNGGASEFRDWVDETAGAGAAADSAKAGGWLDRVFSRDQDDESDEDDSTEGPDHGSRLGSDPDSLSVFSAVQVDDGDESDAIEWDESDELDDSDEASPFFDESENDHEVGPLLEDFEDDDEFEADESEESGPMSDEDDDEFEADESEESGPMSDEDDDEVGPLLEGFEDDDEFEADESEESGPMSDEDDDEVSRLFEDDEEDDDEPVIEFPESSDSDEEAETTFADMWGVEDPESEEDIIDFANFTSEDYVQATTREYAGLAEAVARAEEEDTQQIAVSAEIPGLESGLVGLEDVVSATEDHDTADVIEPPSASDLPLRVLTALGLVALFAASLLSPYGIGALIVVVLGIAAGEMYSALIRAGYRPLSIFGFAGVSGAFFGTWAAGPIAIPISLLLTAVAVFLFYATVPGRRAVLENATFTLLVMAWIGGLGGLAFDLLGSDDYQWLVLALVLTVAAMDIGQYFVGRRIGKHQLAPQISPKKTIEGYVSGVIIAVGMGAAFSLAEPFDLADGLIIGGVVAVIAPLGDLAVSVLKRALGVKDMGYILPGHGGVLDRVDAMIMTIPALWLAYSWMGLVV